MINYIINHIPLSTPCRRRQGIKINSATITIHGTANPSSSALNERGWLTNPSNQRQASFHIVVDDKMAVECIPLNEKALHAGDRKGNETSIGIEICESGDYEKTLENAVELVAKLLKERGWGISHLRKHNDWSGKICPRLMYDGGKWTGWEEFKNMVTAELAAGEEEQPMTKEEREAFDALREDVAAIRISVEAATKLVPAPAWFVKEFGSGDLDGIILDPKLTAEGWRTTAISLRANKHQCFS